MTTALAVQQGGALAQSQQSGRMAVADIISHVAMVQEVMRAVMKPEVHYGVIPGTDKPTLYKQGAEVLCMAFRVADSYQVEDLSTADVVRYRVTCTGVHQINGIVLGTGMGEASSGEEKYKWRKAYKEEFEVTPANLRREKKGYNKQKQESYSTYQVRTEPADLANTILKMANKRAKIAMTINVTACGDMFGQDLEDMDEALRDHLTRHAPDGRAPVEQEKPALPEMSAELFAQRLTEWRTAMTNQVKGATPDNIIGKAKTKYTLTAEQEAAIRAPIEKPAKKEEAATDALPPMVYADVADALTSATTKAELDAAALLIPRVSDEQFRKELDEMHAELVAGVPA
ncbi:hypothetical protein [Variovorax ginsengisoli]|uniref:RecT family protein n=1 Tax=Variovorax ginsengisoli TaxID=363844 RepID=A0ABT8SG82_9BURK|nr:hypothetical protein [Variovorax ginsengisoli]MDN8617822.1 hypothetical protein [Variovorax ginsengisoli]MDO1536992.1 hypothetical protein [Variovorax ginsengisoli]